MMQLIKPRSWSSTKVDFEWIVLELNTNFIEPFALYLTKQEMEENISTWNKENCEKLVVSERKFTFAFEC